MAIRTVLAASAIAVLGISTPLVCAEESSKEEIISEMIEVLQYDKMLGQMGDMVAIQTISQAKARHPDLDAETESELREIARDSFAELLQEMNPMVSRVMSKHFTEEELRQLLAFHKSPIGQKSIEKTPLMMQELMTWSQQEAMKVGPAIMEKIDAALEHSKDNSGR